MSNKLKLDSILLLLLACCLVEGAPGGSYVHWTGVECKFGDWAGPVTCWPWLEWWFLWICGALLLGILGCCLGVCCCGDAFLGGLAGCGLALPCISCPVLLCACFWPGNECELCTNNFSTFGFICLGKGHSHRKACLEKNRSEYDSIPSSSLYKCTKCKKYLKLWPSKKVSKTTCTKCGFEIENDGTNLHICFTCAGKGSFTHHHLCNDHVVGRNLIGVSWNSKNFFGTGDEGMKQQTEEFEPPTYEEAEQHPTISTWDENLANKHHQLIRQYSLGLNRMVSSSGSESPEEAEAQHMLSYPRQPPTNPALSH